MDKSNRFGGMAGCAVRMLAFSVFSLCVAAQGSALAQTPPPKISNPTAIPSTVRPGVIEAELEVEIAPGVTMAPAVVSPYEPEQPPNAAGIEFELTQVVLDGARSVPASVLRPIYADKIGSVVKLSEVFGIARAITRKYADAGYPLSLAYVPVQEIENGVVRIRIIEGFIGDIEIVGAEGGAKKHLAKLADKIEADRPLTQQNLERYLLLANQLPGLSVTGVLERAATPEAGVKMTMKVERKRFGVAGGVNSRASRAVGREQFYGRLGVNSLLTGIDDFNFMTVQSFNPDELHYYASGYSTLLNSEGLRLRLKATRSEAAPGIPFLRVLGFQSMGWTAGAGLSYPFILERNKQLVLAGGFTWKEFESAFGVTPNTRDVLWTTEFGAVFSVKDGWNGSNKFSVNLTKGWDIFDATDAGSPLASRQGAGGEFVTVAADISRTQKLTDWANLRVSMKGQTTNKPLLSSEQCGFGGAGFGRGYDPFEIAGDRCIQGLAELSLSPSFLQHDKFKAQPFMSFDAGAVRQNGALAAGEARTASLYSFGAGARFSLTKHLSASAEIGVPLKGIVAQEGDDDPRFFFAVEARY